MAIGGQLPIGGQVFEWGFFPHRVVATQVVKNTRLQHKEAAVNPGSFAALGLLHKVAHAAVLTGQVEHPEPARLAHSRERGQHTLLAVVADTFFNVDVAHAIAVGQAESLIVQILFYPTQAAAGHGFQAGVH